MNYSNRVEGYSILDDTVALDVEGGSFVTRAVGKTSLEGLRQSMHVKRPSLLEKNKEDPANTIREIIQRKFNGPRVKNRDDFAAYIAELIKGRHGALPALTLYTQEKMALGQDGSVHIKNLTPTIAIDGETQLDALFLAAESDEAILHLPLPFIIHAGITGDEVRVIVHDLNALGRSIKESEVASLNSTSPIVSSIANGLMDGGFSMSEVDRSGDGMGTPKNPKVSSFGRLAAFAAGTHVGPDRIGERVDGFLTTFSHKSACSTVDLAQIQAGVAAFCKLPWPTRKSLGKTEMKVLGAVVKKGGVSVITQSTVDKILANKASAKFQRGNAKFHSMMNGLI